MLNMQHLWRRDRSVSKAEGKKVWKVKEKPNTKEQLLTIGDAVKEKTAAKTSVRIPDWKNKKKKKPESAGPSARGNKPASNISKRNNWVQKMEDDCCPIDIGKAARQKDLKFRGG